MLSPPGRPGRFAPAPQADRGPGGSLLHIQKYMAYTLYMTYTIEAEGLPQVLRSRDRADRSRPARRPGIGLRAARAQRRRQDDARSASSPRSRRPDGGRAASAAMTSPPLAGASARRISLTGQYAAVDEILTGAREPDADGPAAPAFAAASRGGGRTSCSSGSTSSRPPAAGSRTYSGGMRRRLDLAMSLVARPAGAVPRRADHRARPAQPARRLGRRDPTSRQTGVTVLLTTQYLEEADRLADRIAVHRRRARRRPRARPTS